MNRREKAMEKFKEGYNCAQAVVLAYSDLLDMDESTLAKISSSFGGGFGRMREICGSVSGMGMVLGLLYACDDASNKEAKAAHYERVQEVARAFEEKNGSIVCRELLGLSEKHDAPTPEARTNEYYKKRPCAELVGDSAEILEEYISKHPYK